jgi:hypothetical protein
MRDKPSGGKAKNPGSPVAAYERSKRSKTYGPTGGAQPRSTRVAGRGAKDVPRPERGAGRGADDRPRPVRGAGRSNPKPKTEQQMIADQKTLKAKLRGVDYNALGRYMQAKGYGAAGRKAANKGKPTLPKTK